MKLLITNDDGVYAPGIKILAQTLSSLFSSLKDEGTQLYVIAPDRDRSAASHSLTIDNPLRVTELKNGYFSVNGTPTDCVHLAITSLLPDRPDMVVSGINAGANLGDDVLYSGTVAAAIEGQCLGYPTIAISLVGNAERQYTHYQTAAYIASNLVEKIMNNQSHSSLSKEIILNVNVPDLPLSQLKGIKITRLGYRHRAEKISTSVDPKGKKLYWIGSPGAGVDAGPGTDFHAIELGYVSITPLKTDLTDYNAMDELSSWLTNNGGIEFEVI